MDDIPLLHGMEQMETVLLNAMRTMPKGFRKFIVEKTMELYKNSKDSSDEFVGMLALYGLSHIMQMDKRAREEGQ